MFVHSPLVSSQLVLLTSFFVLRIYVGKYLCDDEEENAVGTLSRHRNERQDIRQGLQQVNVLLLLIFFNWLSSNDFSSSIF